MCWRTQISHDAGPVQQPSSTVGCAATGEALLRNAERTSQSRRPSLSAQKYEHDGESQVVLHRSGLFFHRLAVGAVLSHNGRVHGRGG